MADSWKLSKKGRVEAISKALESNRQCPDLADKTYEAVELAQAKVLIEYIDEELIGFADRSSIENWAESTKAGGGYWIPQTLEKLANFLRFMQQLKQEVENG